MSWIRAILQAVFKHELQFAFHKGITQPLLSLFTTCTFHLWSTIAFWFPSNWCGSRCRSSPLPLDSSHFSRMSEVIADKDEYRDEVIEVDRRSEREKIAKSLWECMSLGFVCRRLTVPERFRAVLVFSIEIFAVAHLAFIGIFNIYRTIFMQSAKDGWLKSSVLIHPLLNTTSCFSQNAWPCQAS